MDSIWGDPWADNAKPDLPESKKNDPSKVPTYEPVKLQKTLLSGGFEDEAGWGDFEESTGLGIDGAVASENQELGWNTGQGHEDEKDFTKGLAPEISFKHANGSDILSPGWGDSHTLQSTPEAFLNNPQNDDTSAIPLPPGLESPRSSISEILCGPGTLDAENPSGGKQSAELDEHLASGSPPRPSTSSTTKTAVSTDSNAFSDILASPTHHDGSRWDRKPSHSDATDDSNNSLDSARTSFEEGYVPSKQAEVSALYIGKVEELSAADVGSSRNAVHADEELESPQEEKHHDGTHLDDLQIVVKGPRFRTNLNLVQDLFTPPILSEGCEQVNDEIIESISTRKAWYRLTRPQTMREFNAGSADDNYVRVSWSKSHIRTETLKIATRWASEDRINGHVVLGGKPGAATFSWDVPIDGSIIPPRPMSMISSSQHKKECGIHHASHHRQSSMPHPSSRTNLSPTAHFGWSTSPVSSGDGVIASLGDVLESRAVPTASESQAQHASVCATAQPPLPIASPCRETIILPPSEPRLEKQQGSDSPVLSKVDTTHSTLHASLEDDDDEWGEMVKSPSKPMSPMVLPSLPAVVVETRHSSIDEHAPIISSRRRLTPIIAPTVAQSFPDSTLRPARKAALEVARATRFLQSQPIRSGSPITGDKESNSTTSSPRRLSTSPSLSPTMRASLSLARSPSPTGSIRSATEVFPIASSSFLEADLSVFESPPQHPNSPHSIRDVNAPVQLSTIEEEHAQLIVRKMPNLSFMLR